MTTDIAALIPELDDASTDIAESAKHLLIAEGAAVIPDLAAALPRLERFGKLSAIEIFEACGDRQAGPALAQLNTRLRRAGVRPTSPSPLRYAAS